MRQHYFLLLLLLLYLPVHAQYNLPQNKVWVMGKHVGLDFNGSGNPLPIVTALDSALEGGSASVCDAQGQLLFYTNSRNVWTVAGAVMPHGTGYKDAGRRTLFPADSRPGRTPAAGRKSG